MNSIENLVEKFGMKPHPEGGWYAESYRSTETINHSALPERFSGDRCFSTAIYFLLPAGVFSAFHRICSDECWHFYEGMPLNLYVIDKNGFLSIIKLGKNIDEGERYQAIVPAGCWFASMPATGEGFSLVGCTVSPGFDFEDFELAKRKQLSALYPMHEQLINRLCRE
jgi:predicted cupin superfamily sugar epimerase